jgi:hypothetical protein
VTLGRQRLQPKAYKNNNGTKNQYILQNETFGRGLLKKKRVQKRHRRPPPTPPPPPQQQQQLPANDYYGCGGSGIHTVSEQN